MSTTAKGRKECLEWLFWQVGNLGPMAGQLSHFVNYAKSVQEGDHLYAHERYAGEYNRCLGVLKRRLAKPLGQSLDEFPNLSRWRDRIKSRPAV
jgi:GSH-dependent disulfide-bond oxidoreductase